MTQAICLKCGAMKIGAFTPCPNCGFIPETSEDKARHLILTDWYFPLEKLEYYANKVKAGESVEFGEDTLARFVAYVKTGKFPSS